MCESMDGKETVPSQLGWGWEVGTESRCGWPLHSHNLSVIPYIQSRCVCVMIVLYIGR
jgi:hypothetical protein